MFDMENQIGVQTTNLTIIVQFLNEALASARMGKYLSQVNQQPELVISSTALRARDTAEIAIRSGNGALN